MRDVLRGDASGYLDETMAVDEDLRTRFGNRCRALRQRRKLSQLDMVRQFDISLSHLQKVERGDLDVRLSTAAKLAKCFGVTLSELMRGV